MTKTNLKLIFPADVDPGLVGEGLEVPVQVDGDQVLAGPHQPGQPPVATVAVQTNLAQLNKITITTSKLALIRIFSRTMLQNE